MSESHHSDPGPRGSLPVDEETLDDQAPLPIAAEVAPIDGDPSRGRFECPSCSRDVSSTRRPHRIDVDLVDEAALEALGADEVPVYGWRCDYCSLVLPLDADLARREPAIAPDVSGWGVVRLAPSRGTRIRGLVPNREVLGR
ncbi:hypothetical protein [Haloplanus natans]|uniref:hypothetical protein n=1 Tax=Haloplanus natans TaxID=376171 RepID=UPI000677E896|nr:hypothetical protein [Haloplanus natans]